MVTWLPDLPLTSAAAHVGEQLKHMALRSSCQVAIVEDLRGVRVSHVSFRVCRPGNISKYCGGHIHSGGRQRIQLWLVSDTKLLSSDGLGLFPMFTLSASFFRTVGRVVNRPTLSRDQRWIIPLNASEGFAWPENKLESSQGIQFFPLQPPH